MYPQEIDSVVQVNTWSDALTNSLQSDYLKDVHTRSIIKAIGDDYARWKVNAETVLWVVSFILRKRGTCSISFQDQKEGKN